MVTSPSPAELTDGVDATQEMQGPRGAEEQNPGRKSGKVVF